jgi:hypothetical protein
MNLDPVFSGMLLASFAILFGSAAGHKWRTLGQFRQIFAAYGVLPHSWRDLATLVPVLETLVAAGLLVQRTRVPAGALGLILLACYAGAMALNLLRGRRDIACGCGGPDERRPIAAWMVWRNGVLLLLLTVGLLPSSGRSLQVTDWLTLACSLAAMILVYLCADRLGQIAQQARMPRGAP